MVARFTFQELPAQTGAVEVLARIRTGSEPIGREGILIFPSLNDVLLRGESVQLRRCDPNEDEKARQS